MSRLRLVPVAMAVLAVLATAAPVASAHEFHLGASPAIVATAQLQEHVTAFEANGGFGCSSVSMQGTTTTATTAELRLHPTYSGCALFGSGATIATSGCDYVLSGKTVEANTAQVSISCETGKQIEINWAAGCLIKFGSQTPARGFDFTNKKGSPTVIIMTMTVGGVSYEATGPMCSFFTGKATLTGEFALRAFVDEKGKAGEGVSISLE
jgi:hypothetical protein